MRNCFDLEVCFSDYPSMPYEWENSSLLTNIKVIRISSRRLLDIIMYNGKIENINNRTLALSDTKNAIAIRLDKEGNIVARSFLKYRTDEDVCECACSLNIFNIEFKKGTKVKSKKSASLEDEVKAYIKSTIRESSDIDLKKYIYYVYTGKVDYSKEKLECIIESASSEENIRLYKMLH